MEQIKINRILKFIEENFYSAFASTDYRCLICDAKTSNVKEYLCADCRNELSVENNNKCRVCGRLTEKEVCSYCIKNKKPYERVYTIFEYTNPIDTYINEFKEQGKTLYGRMFSSALIDKYKDLNLNNIDIIANVPAQKLRKIARLRDAPKYFAKTLSKHTKIKYSNKCLKRRGFSKAMRKKSTIQRMEMANKNYLIGSYKVKDKNILLVDDVFTSGATAHVCSNLLIGNGAKSVTILVMVCVKSR